MHDRNVVTDSRELLDERRADEARAADDKNLHSRGIMKRAAAI